jgi:hypothetical protein
MFFRDVPIVAPHQDQLNLPPVCAPENLRPMAPPNPDEARAVEAVFAHSDENAQVAALLGFWTSAVVLNDLLQDAAEELDDSGEPVQRKPGRDTH